MKEEFHGVVKLITGEEIFALISIEETEEEPIIMLQSPVVMKILHNGTGQYVKIKPWLDIPEEDLYLIKMDKIITMTEISDGQMIMFYEKYLNESAECDFELDGRVTLNPKMGLVSTVEDARQRLENIYKDNIKES